MHTEGSKSGSGMGGSCPIFPFVDEAGEDLFALGIDDPIPFDEILSLLEQASSLCDDVDMLEPTEERLNQSSPPQHNEVEIEKPPSGGF